MKSSLRYLVPVLGLLAAAPFTRAADESKPVTKTEKKELRVLAAPDHHGAIMRRLAGAGEKENVTFLGVETAPVSATLIAQLGLTEGYGLVVNHIVADSPAAGALKQHDILLKLDDQLLIEQRQLAVLVRNHKEGDEVTVTYVRGGKQATAKVKLAKKEMPKLSLAMPGTGDGAFGYAFGNGSGNGGGAGTFDVRVLPRTQLEDGADVDRLLGLMNVGPVPGQHRMNIFAPSGAGGERTVSVTVNTGNSHVVLDDDKGSLDLSIKDGEKQLVAKNAKGEQLFSGPVNTPEERKALPADVRARLEKLEDSTSFRFKTDADFKGAEAKVIRPYGQGIALPRHPAPEPHRASLFL